MINSVRSINSTNRFVDAKFVDQPKDYPIEGRTMVINPNLTPVFIGETPVRHIPAFSSTILQDTRIEQAESVLLFRVSDEPNMADIVTEPDWGLLADLMPGFPRETRLYRGPQEHIGTVEFDPALALGELYTTGPRTFEVKVNLWFAPAGTDCAIHNEHEFIEIHTQIHGYGRMQKFRAPDHATLYEDLLMSPGYTTPVPFCGSRLDGGFTYPWHQYRADSDCVWLAVEYHAA
jgi:hypothetical protein